MSTSRLQDLIALAHEPSSERRRTLLREVTDAFFGSETEPHSAKEAALYDEVLSALTSEMEEEVRIELSRRFADSDTAPKGLVNKLAADTIAVAGPVLSRSRLVSDEVLLHVARTQGQEHLRAISQRESVSEVLSDAIVERGDDTTLGELLRNEGAQLSRAANEAAVDRAAANPELHEAVVSRRSLPPDLLNEMYFVVEQKLREQILARNSDMDPEALEDALSAGRDRLAQRDGAVAADYIQARQAVKAMIQAGTLTPSALASILRAKEHTKFLVALSELTQVDFNTARKIMERREMDALAVICKTAGFDRALFVTIAIVLLDREQNAMGRVAEYGKLYDELPMETATRTLRFWQMRRKTPEAA